MRGTRGKHISERLRGSREQLQVQEAADANQIGGGDPLIVSPKGR